MYTCERTLFCGENANKHDLCSGTLYLVSAQLFVVVIIGGEGGDSFTDGHNGVNRQPSNGLTLYRQRFSLRKTYFLPLNWLLKCYGAKCH